MMVVAGGTLYLSGPGRYSWSQGLGLFHGVKGASDFPRLQWQVLLRHQGWRAPIVLPPTLQQVSDQASFTPRPRSRSFLLRVLQDPAPGRGGGQQGLCHAGGLPPPPH